MKEKIVPKNKLEDNSNKNIINNSTANINNTENNEEKKKRLKNMINESDTAIEY